MKKSVDKAGSKQMKALEKKQDKDGAKEMKKADFYGKDKENPKQMKAMKKAAGVKELKSQMVKQKPQGHPMPMSSEEKASNREIAKAESAAKRVKAAKAAAANRMMASDKPKSNSKIKKYPKAVADDMPEKQAAANKKAKAAMAVAYKAAKKAGPIKKPKDTPADNTVKDNQQKRMGPPKERPFSEEGRNNDRKNVMYGEDDTPKLKYRKKK